MSNISFFIAKCRALTQPEQAALLTAWACLPLFWLGLRVLGLPRFQSWLRKTPTQVVTTVTLPVIQALGEIVNIAARHTPFPATCLTRSLLLGWLLRRRGIQSDLRIGVRLTNGALDAHAWVECGGIPVNDKSDVASDFASFGDLVPVKAFSAP